MQPSQWEIIVLKPTKVFLSFLAAQINDIDLPDLRLLQTDNTAYVIPKQTNDEETLNEIERHFPTMFRHEICRWLGKEARNDIEGSFLDFLCCFKFELHSHIVLMEDSVAEGRQLLRVRPRSVLLKWMKTAVEDDHELSNVLERVNISHLAENATVVIKNFDHLAEIKPFLKEYYRPIFEAEMLRMCDREEQWPDIDSYQAFSRYFTVDIHTQLIHLQ
ncbi:hypothetical protein DIZ81_07560 [Legionella taurinensis]|uniref:Uncharacterized protein n=1 Tax=Legionella taurinensis TaxID=70611 RepID=A0A3A5L5Z9_9GAMM|nr:MULTISPECIES: hypothetical protein [Legionella]MDX1837071.1 hypothetical protein [Legionella taurinensis]PUT40441.1 hypothetical protein DB744_07560 [Legionella taurinensis]PUT40467.1 hypothetical protein DB746_11280 [Legionella taurinensis]PUT42712.1 hypothetical protein DB743_11765 [Legionella taurinensis]PUT48503.1 hypothetical protein DB745_05960 [Legionella taurinensis]